MSKQQEPHKVRVGEEALQCVVCKNDGFWIGSALLNSRMRTFWNLDWTNRSADYYECSQCGYLMWFASRDRRR